VSLPAYIKTLSNLPSVGGGSRAEASKTIGSWTIHTPSDNDDDVVVSVSGGAGQAMAPGMSAYFPNVDLSTLAFTGSSGQQRVVITGTVGT
jgi:hypothetical protein